MTIHYVDPENGNDSNNGQSFANRKKTISSGVADNDEIRFIKSPEPTSLGNGSWEEEGTFNSNKIVSDTRRAGSGTCNFTGNGAGTLFNVYEPNHGLLTGDAVYIEDEDDDYAFAGIHLITKVDDDNFTLDGTASNPSNDSATGYVYKINPFVVRLASSPIKNIICYQGLDGGGDLDWTANVGTTARETTAEGGGGYRTARNFNPGSNDAGKIAHVQLNNTLDLSGYQQISFKYRWAYSPGSNLKQQPDFMSIRLCSDTSGDTTVHTVPVKPPAGDDNGQWGWYTHDFGTNLNSSIQSVALYTEMDDNHANTDFILDNVIACKAKSSADSLHLGSLIGKGTTHMSNWYPIKGIVDKIVFLECTSEDTYGFDSTTTRPLNETTETVTTYKRECFTNPEYYNSDENGDGIFVRDLGRNVTVSGGWNTTDMSSQDTNAGTWLAMQSRQYTAIQTINQGNLNISNLGFVRGYQSVEIHGVETTGPSTITNCQSIIPFYGMHGTARGTFTNCRWYGTQAATSDNDIYRVVQYTFKDCTFEKCKLLFTAKRGEPTTFNNCSFFQTTGGTTSFLATGLYRNIAYFNSCAFKHMTGIAHGEDYEAFYSLVNCTFDEAEPLQSSDQDDGVKNDIRPYLSFINYNNTANDHRLYYLGALITSDSSVTQSGTGFSWKYTQFLGTSTANRSANYPVKFKLAEVYAIADSQITATIYGRRGAINANDYLVLAALAADNGSIGIVTDAKSSALSASANTWQQLTLTFTPTKSGVATIHALMSTEMTNGNIWIDTFAIN